MTNKLLTGETKEVHKWSPGEHMFENHHVFHILTCYSGSGPRFQQHPSKQISKLLRSAGEPLADFGPETSVINALFFLTNETFKDKLKSYPFGLGNKFVLSIDYFLKMLFSYFSHEPS